MISQETLHSFSLFLNFGARLHFFNMKLELENGVYRLKCQERTMTSLLISLIGLKIETAGIAFMLVCITVLDLNTTDYFLGIAIILHFLFGMFGKILYTFGYQKYAFQLKTVLETNQLLCKRYVLMF